MAGHDEVEMKAWQKGIPLTVLKDIEAQYKVYNSYSCSPFSEVKKHRIADAIAKGEHQHQGFCRYDLAEAKVKGKIVMYGKVTIGEKLPGDCTITNLTFTDAEKTSEHLSTICDPCWAFAWADWQEQNDVLVNAGFNKVGVKITSFAEIYNVYFKNGQTSTLFEDLRQHPILDPLEHSTLDRMDVSIDKILPHVQDLQRQLSELSLDFTDHYSNYNAKHSWGALSLRGYTPDPEFITKPEEMNKKWHQENENETFRLQDTELRSLLPATEKLLTLLPGVHHRIRLMRLTAGGGELRRHTDQVDPDAGVMEGQLLRFHFPIITNDDVKFTMWNTKNEKKEVNMRVGELWAIDTRKPHMAINGGEDDRIHLVIDVEANNALRELIYKSMEV
jgi:hypothetical protein